jgi:DNA-binding response OmpR family regulator
MNNYKLLFVEDDRYLGLIVTDYFETKGFDVFYCYNAEKAFDILKNNRISLCLLDINLPHKNGFELAKDIKKLNNNIPIIFLTAQTDKKSVLNGFTIGADDYVRKPFLLDELYLRVKSVLNRAFGNIKPNTKINLGNYIFDYQFQTLKSNDTEKVLTFKETELLKLFVENMNKIITKETIVNKVWNNNDMGLSRSIDVYITKLRKLFAKDKNIQIVNIRGIGYKMLISQHLQQEHYE